jgi:hypothetical protein
MAQAVSRRPLTLEAQVRSRGQFMWDLWWAKWHWDRFFPPRVILFSPDKCRLKAVVPTLATFIYYLNITNELNIPQLGKSLLLILAIICNVQDIALKTHRIWRRNL